MPNPIKTLVGGSFAPPLSDEKLARYKALATALKPSAVKDAMLSLLKCCDKWWELPEPVGTAKTKHPTGSGTIIALQDDHAKELYDLIPWEHELEAMDKVLDTLDPSSQKDLRNAAYHLLWHVRELNLDREPLTNDKL